MSSVESLDTPAVTIDLDRLEANIARVQGIVSRRRIGLRPHIKTHKIPEIARMQMAAGAVGLTCQKLDEVEAFADAAVADDVLLTFNIVGERKTDRLMELSTRLRRLAVVADNAVVVKGLSDAGVRHGRDVPLLIECDVGFGRNGVQGPEQALALARIAQDSPRIRLEGIAAYPTGSPAAIDAMTRIVARLEQEGISVPVVSGGGSPALASISGASPFTEHRAGTYVYNDVMMVHSGVATWDDCAMLVRATVVSVPTPERAIIDAGSKTLTREQHYVQDFGRVVEYPDAPVANLSEEHGIIDISRSAKKPAVGEVVTIIPNHACVVSNMVDAVYAFRDGWVEHTWAVVARGGTR